VRQPVLAAIALSLLALLFGWETRQALQATPGGQDNVATAPEGAWRPGVPTTIRTPLRNCAICPCIGCPPYTGIMVTSLLYRASFLSSSETCTASSRVGQRTSASTFLPCSFIACRIGMPNAAVFPVPVCA